jgi:hypothetical protein
MKNTPSKKAQSSLMSQGNAVIPKWPNCIQKAPTRFLYTTPARKDA